MAAGFGLLRGRRGAGGYIRGREGKREAVITGLDPGAEGTLYCLEKGRLRFLGQGRADGGGRLTLSGPEEGLMFLACGGSVAAWEDDGSLEEGYLRCCAALNREKAKTEPPQPVPEARIKETEAAPAAEAPPERAAFLRAPSDSPPVDGLPRLLWPRGTEEVRAYFDALPPFAPFPAPGWRFVRLPSPLPGTAYCALGRYARDGRVQRLAYAVPGAPQRPPAALPGYRYHRGFWVFEKAL